MWSEVDRYITGKLIADDPGPAHDHAVSPPQGALLELLARAVGARRILEIGTLEGYSMLWLARSGAGVVTLELDPARAARARTALGEHAEVIAGVRATAIQTVGAKGYDGFALALVGG